MVYLFLFLSSLFCTQLKANWDYSENYETVQNHEHDHNHECDYTYEHFQCCEDYNFELRGELLVWKVHQSCLDYADAFSQQKNPLIVERQFLEHDWNAGVRLSLSYNFCSSLNLELLFTHFSEESQEAGVFDNTIASTLLWNKNPNAGLSERVEGSIEFEYNTLELKLSSTPFYCGATTLRPFIGIRALWIDHSTKMTYFESLSTSPSISTFLFDSNTRSVGLNGGSELNFAINTNLTFCTQLDFSILAARQKNLQKERAFETNGSLDLGDHNFDINEKQYTALFEGHTSIALAYETHCWSQTSMRFQFGYELSYLNHSPNRRSFVGDGENINIDSSQHILMHGFFLGGSLFF